MTIQQAIAELEGTAEVRERLADRLFAFVEWWKTVPPEQLGSTEFPNEHKITNREVSLSFELTVAALRSAEEYAPGTLIAWEDFRKTPYVASPALNEHWKYSEELAINMRASVLFLRRTAGVLQSLASQKAERAAVAERPRE